MIRLERSPQPVRESHSLELCPCQKLRSEGSMLQPSAPSTHNNYVTFMQTRGLGVVMYGGVDAKAYNTAYFASAGHASISGGDARRHHPTRVGITRSSNTRVRTHLNGKHKVLFEHRVQSCCFGGGHLLTDLELRATPMTPTPDVSHPTRNTRL